jgi:hypothetical protein
MNIEHNYHVHKYNTRGSRDPHISGYTTSLYQNSVANMDIKLYNKLLEKIKRLHTLSNFKKGAAIHNFAKCFLYRRIFTGSIVVVVGTGNRGK